MNENYNRKKHIELLKKKSETTLSKKESSELLNYSYLLLAHLNWKIRYDYLELLQDFQKGKMEDLEFCSTFVERVMLTEEIINMLESNISLLSLEKELFHEKSSNFSDLVEEIFDISNMHFEDENHFSEIKFKNLIQRTYLKMRNYLIK